MAEGKLRGKTALVTGAAKRVGLRIALALAAEGVNVIIHYRSSADGAQEAVKEVEKLGARGWTVQADFEKAEGYEGLIGRCLGMTGGLDILVNNASIFPMSTLKEITFEGLAKNIRVNAWAPFSLIKEFALKAGRGKIVNLIDARISGFDWNHAEYILSKHLFFEITRMAAVEFAPDIQINGINPGLILPPPGKDERYLERLVTTVPLKRHGTPEDIADAAVYLLESDFLTGTVIDVDGGRHLLEYKNGPYSDK